MEYLIGATMALGVGVFLSVTGFDRERSLYPVILIVIASYYDLFAVMAGLDSGIVGSGGGGTALAWEIGAFAVFALAAVVGFKTNLWVVVAALVGHGLFDGYHGQWIDNAGVPAWWPMWCLSYDVGAGGYLAWRLLSKKIAAAHSSSFGMRIAPYVTAELAASAQAGNPGDAFRHLERAHVLGQRSPVQHVRVHIHMLLWAMRRKDLRESVGQLARIMAAATGTFIGIVPEGNTGGSRAGPFKMMAIPEDLARHIAAARTDLRGCRLLS